MLFDTAGAGNLVLASNGRGISKVENIKSKTKKKSKRTRKSKRTKNTKKIKKNKKIKKSKKSKKTNKKNLKKSTSVLDISLKAELKYEINLENFKHAVQAYVIRGNDLFITQTYKKVDDKKPILKRLGHGFKNQNVVVLSKYTLKDGAYEYVSSMYLINAGHGQTLEYLGDDYFLIECGYYFDKQTGNEWSNQIGRIKYQNDTILYNKDIKHFSYLSYMGERMKGDVIKRVSAGLSSDGSKLIVWKRTVSNREDYIVYSMSMINALWNQTKSNDISCKDNAFKKMQASDKNYKICKDVNVPKSIQGIEISNDDKGISSIYFSSGDEDEGRKLRIYRFNTNGKKKCRRSIDYSSIWPKANDRKVEIEGIRICGDTLQFVLKDLKTKKHVIAFVYKKDLK